MTLSRQTQFTRCACRRAGGHTWNHPDNQRWELVEPLTRGRRTLRQVRCVSTCDQCQSARVETFLVDKRDCLAERVGRFYRQSEEYRRRERLDTDRLNWFSLPESIVAGL